MSRILTAWSLLGAAVLVAGSPRGARAADEKFAVTVVDEKTREPIPCRMHLLGPNGNRPRRPDPTIPFWADHFVFPGSITLRLPLGQYTFEMERGPEYLHRDGNFVINRNADDSKQVDLRRVVDMSAEGWWSGDLLVRRPARNAQLLMTADDLHVAQFVTWWNEKTDWQRGGPPKNPLARFDKDRWYNVLAGGYDQAGTEVLCFNLPAPSPRQGGPAEYPPLVEHLIELRREQPDLWVDVASPFSWDLPLLVAHGQVQSIQVLHRHYCRKTMVADLEGGRPPDRKFYPGPHGYARWGQDIYFRLLDCGFEIPPTAGSGSGMTPNPVGYNRLYAHVDGSLDYAAWWKNLRAGRVVVTNGPLLRPTVEGQLPGHTFHADDGKTLELEIGLTLSTREPISYLDVVQDGEVRHSIRFEEYAKSGRLPKLEFKKSGWFLLRVVTDVSETYRCAMTGPYYVQFGSQPRISKRSAQFFLDWVKERVGQIAIDDAHQRAEVLEFHRRARDFWQDLVSRANAD
ncbi:MAG: hypothetical protein ABR915_03605 [Thermoguttaceae bacterium]|jgi:hypothetical protein